MPTTKLPKHCMVAKNHYQTVKKPSKIVGVLIHKLIHTLWIKSRIQKINPKSFIQVATPHIHHSYFHIFQKQGSRRVDTALCRSIISISKAEMNYIRTDNVHDSTSSRDETITSKKQPTGQQLNYLTSYW